MGPQCPHCGAIYEWTCGELEEQITAPKVYFCQECRELFILAPDDVIALQERFRPALEESVNADAGDLGDFGDPDEETEAAVEPFEVPLLTGPVPFGLRDRVVVVDGPYAGSTGTVVVVDGGDVMLRIDGDAACVRVSIHQLRRAA
jgi:hypothetical protein